MPYALVAMYNTGDGPVVEEPLHKKGYEMLGRLLCKSKDLTTAEHAKCENYRSMSPLHAVDVPKGWGVLVMIHGATTYNKDRMVSECLTLHSAITESLMSTGDVLNVLDRIELTLKWQLEHGKLISCDLRPPNVIAFTCTLLDIAKGTNSNDFAQVPLVDDEANETEVSRALAKTNLEDAKALAGSFPCEEGTLVWTLIDFGFCVIDGLTTIPEGAAWDLIRRVVGGETGKRKDVSMEPREWMKMLYMAVIQLQTSR